MHIPMRTLHCTLFSPKMEKIESVNKITDTIKYKCGTKKYIGDAAGYGICGNCKRIINFQASGQGCPFNGYGCKL